jgi:uncharacterized protein
MKNKTIPVVFLAVFFVLAIFYYSYSKNYKKVEINEKKFNVELAQTQKKQSLGLGQRENIKDNYGMLFVFPQSADYSFWMKDMKFDLDILWIEDGKIVYIEKNVSHGYLKAINSNVSADMVLEIKAGISEKHGFKIGDEVKIY